MLAEWILLRFFMIIIIIIIISLFLTQKCLFFLSFFFFFFYSTEKQFLYPLQSQIICESQSISLPVSTLVCDCLGDGGEECYETGEQQKELIMGLSEVCEGETNFVKVKIKKLKN